MTVRVGSSRPAPRALRRRLRERTPSSWLDRSSSPTVPIVKWAGGKRSVLPQLLALVPPRFSTYYEPFLGGGAFFLALEPDRAVIGDANCELIAAYAAVRDEPEAVMAALDRMQPYVRDRDFYYWVRSQDPSALPPAERAARFIFLNKTCYNGLYRVNRAGAFNVPFGRYTRPPILYDRANLERVSQLFRRAELRCADFALTVESAGEEDFVYLDPPYVPLTRTANFTKYTSGDFDAADQRRLAEVVHRLTGRGCRVLLSNSDMPLVRELYPEPPYIIETVYAPRNINSDAGGRSRIPELAIRNYRLD